MNEEELEVDGDLPRIKLPSFTSVQHVVDAISKSRKIIVITGAGISVSSGIPDFRSKDIGLYNTLDLELYNIPSAELLFDYEFFRIDAEPFYKFASKLLPDENMRPSPCHNFIACLEAKGKLLRNYTQNVDGLERKAGITRVIECHGSMMNFRCMDCKRKSTLAAVRKEVAAGCVVYCRSASCGGILKPDITFFGENLPDPFFKAIKQDVSKCDLVIVIGTSLKVGGSVHLLLKHVEDHVPQVLINREAVVPPAHISGGFDVSLLGECDQVSQFLCDSLQWALGPLPTAGDANDAAACEEHQKDKIKIISEDISKRTVRCSKGQQLKKRARDDGDDHSGAMTARDAAHSQVLFSASSSSSKLSKCATSSLCAADVATFWQCTGSSDRVFSVSRNMSNCTSSSGAPGSDRATCTDLGDAIDIVHGKKSRKGSKGKNKIEILSHVKSEVVASVEITKTKSSRSAARFSSTIAVETSKWQQSNMSAVPEDLPLASSNGKRGALPSPEHRPQPKINSSTRSTSRLVHVSPERRNSEIESAVGKGRRTRQLKDAPEVEGQGLHPQQFGDTQGASTAAGGGAVAVPGSATEKRSRGRPRKICP